MSRFRTFVKYLLIPIVIVATIWLAVIVWWQTSQRVVTMQDMVVYLGAVPLAALLCLGLLQWRTSRRKQPAHAADDAAAGAATEAGSATANAPVIQLPILSAWAVTCIAADPEEFAQALRDRQARPLPDALLTDDHGFPLLTGRIADLDTAAIQEDLIRIAAERKTESNPDAQRDGFLRTLALLSNLLDRVLADLPLDLTAGALEDCSVDAVTLRGAAPLSSIPDQRLRLNIKLLLPTHFDTVERQLALAYLMQRTADIPLSNEYLQLDLAQATDDASALEVIDRFSADSCRDNRAQALLLLACDSALCDTVAQDWLADGRMFSAHCPNGQMMGEAGFAVLCANDQALKSAAAHPACRLTRISRAQRDTSADTPGKPSYASLSQAIKDALLAANISGETIGAIACDADHRTNRTLECMGAMMDQTPHLDAIQNRLASGEACGHLGAASVAGALVAAIMQSKASEQPVLLFNVSHAIDRAAAVLIPPAMADAEPPITNSHVA